MAGNSNEPSHKPTVDAVRKYYYFLADDLGAIQRNCIVEPPEEGWPSTTQDSLAGLEKIEAVIELLRHLPAIDYREIGEYKVAEGKRFQFIPAGNEEFPPDVMVLTDEGEDYYGSLLLLDTKKGTATDYQPQAPRKKGMPDPETTADIWRLHLTPNDYICAGPPGGIYVPPPPPPRSNSDNNQQRGGNDGSSTERFGNATVHCNQAQQPDPVQDGMLSSCKTWCQAYPDNYSYQFAMETNMTQAQLYQWNPVLGDGDNEQKKRNEDKTYSSRDSHVVTHRSTNLPFNCLCMAERTGCPVFS
ncbi:hypothetical protein KCU91_g12438, partial [Aureobasidium melanogenum]